MLHRTTISGIGRLLALFLAVVAGVGAQAKIQFDVFPGYDSVVRSGAWFPVQVEVFNDGPGFDGVIELTQGQMGGVRQRFAVELPSNTRKRILLNCFSSSQGFLAVDARLLDKEGKVRAESTGLRLTQVVWENFLLGALPQTFGGMPSFPETTGRQSEQQPRVTRLALGQGVETFPDTPIALEALNGIYVNSAKAAELKEPQVEALLAWLHGGGHLIVAVDQPSDVTATAWLRNLLPVDVKGVETRGVGAEVETWLRSGLRPGSDDLQFGLQPPPSPMSAKSEGGDPFQALASVKEFATATVPVAGFRLLNGVAMVSATDGSPVVVSASRGRGLLTVLAFSPEREPFKSWKNKAWMWARLAGVPRDLLVKGDFNAWGGRGIDAIFGAMIETRQVQKLPVGVLLLLLLVYLAVIGPIDQWWLKKIRRPMLTWITFPSYVVLFSLLIYYIGFRLRAGNSEWNEFHVVDVYPRGGDAVLRGRTFGSVYSPANNVYRVGIDQASAHFRNEFQGMMGGVGGGRTVVREKTRGFEADLEVPVWTSMLGVADWVDSGSAPIQAKFEGQTLALANRREIGFTNIVVIRNRRVYPLPPLAAGGTTRFDFAASAESTPYQDIPRDWAPTFQNVSNRRGEVFGGNTEEHIDAWGGAAIAASLVRGVGDSGGGGGRGFIWPPGLDLTPLVDRGDTVILAYVPGDSLVPDLNRFSALRRSKGTLLRLVLPASR